MVHGTYVLVRVECISDSLMYGSVWHIDKPMAEYGAYYTSPDTYYVGGFSDLLRTTGGTERPNRAPGGVIV